MDDLRSAARVASRHDLHAALEAVPHVVALPLLDPDYQENDDD